MYIESFFDNLNHVFTFAKSTDTNRMSNDIPMPAYMHSAHYDAHIRITQAIREHNIRLIQKQLLRYRARRTLLDRRNCQWKTILRKNNGSVPSCHVCSICLEPFVQTDYVTEGAPRQYYHQKEFTKWIRNTSLDQVTDPNTNLPLMTVSTIKPNRSGFSASRLAAISIDTQSHF